MEEIIKFIQDRFFFNEEAIIHEIIVIIGTFWSFSTIGVPLIIEFFFEKIYMPKTKTWRSITSWLIPIGVVYILWFFEVGFLAEYALWWIPALLGALAATVGNYTWASIPWIKELITRIIEFLPKTKKND